MTSITATANVVDFAAEQQRHQQRQDAATDFTITEMFKIGYQDGRDSVEEVSRETSFEQGLADGVAGKPASYEPEVYENVPSVVGFTSTEEGARAFGWDLGWRDEIQDEYRKGYAEGRFQRLLGS